MSSPDSFSRLLWTLAILFGSTRASAVFKFDCPLPEGVDAATKELCERYSACAWTSEAGCKLTDQVGYIPDPSDGTRKETKTYMRRKSNVTMFGGDIDRLQMTEHELSKAIVRYTIRDPSKRRYEVPLQLNFPTSTETTAKPTYKAFSPNETEDDVLISFAEGEGGSFATIALDSMIYSEQFIEIHILFRSENVYGFGENNHDSFRHNVSDGTTWPMFARDLPPGDGHENLYGVHPFFLTMLETPLVMSFGILFVNSNAMEYRFQRHGPVTLLTLRSTGGILDMVVFLGASPMDVLKSYHNVIGLPAMPPYWGLGFQLSRFGYKSTTDIRAIYARNQLAGVPQDIQYSDIDYMDQHRDFTIDSHSFHDLAKLVTEMRAKGVHFVLIYDPAIAIDFGSYAPVDRGVKRDVFVKWMNASLVPQNQCAGCKDYIVGRVWPRNRTLFPDFLNNETVQWWVDEMRQFYTVAGKPDGFWIDMNEPSNFGTNMATDPTNLQCPKNRYDSPPYPTMIVRDPNNESNRLSDKTICMSAKHRNTAFPSKPACSGDAEDTDQSDPDCNSRTDDAEVLHYDAHNLYGWSEYHATRRAMDAVLGDRRGVLVGRSTYPGAGRWGGHWTGDNTARWRDLKRSIVGILEFSMFGIPYVGADICGFNGNSSETLCLRWMQLGAFYPFCRNHNTDDAVDQDPAVWPSVARASRQALGLRYRLLPALYTLFYLAQQHGVLVVRPLAFQFPADKSLRAIDTQFLWGDCIMVAPVLTEERITQVDVVFPAGGWYDLRNGTLARRSGQTGSIGYHVPLQHMIPVFAREGCILPMQTNESNTQLSRRNPFQLHVFGAEAKGELFWDDGDSRSSIAQGRYYQGFFHFDKSTLTTTPAQLHTDSMHDPHLDIVVLYGIAKPPTTVIVDGRPLNKANMFYDSIVATLTLSSLRLHMAKPHTIKLY